MTYAYIRVSTDHQNIENQKHEILEYCKYNHIHVDQWVIDVMSGIKKPEQRNLGKEIMNNCKPGDLVLCTELSRLGRSFFMIMTTLNFFLESKVSVHTIKDKFNLSDDLQSKVISFAFGLAAEIERQLISQRTKTALQRAKEQGIHVGRHKGRKSSYYKLDSKELIILQRLSKGATKTEIAEELNVNIGTLNSQLERMGIL